MLAIARWVHVASAWLFVVGVLVQGYLAGAALGQLGGSNDFGAYVAVGYSAMGSLALAVLVTAIVGHLPRAHVGLSFALLILYIVQTALPTARASSPAIAALHPPNAMLLLVVGVFVAWRARRLATPAATD